MLGLNRLRFYLNGILSDHGVMRHREVPLGTNTAVPSGMMWCVVQCVRALHEVGP